MRAYVIGTAITLFWLTMMATLVRYHVLPHRRAVRTVSVEPAALAGAWRDYEEEMAIRVRDQHVGRSWLQLERGENQLTYLAKFDLRLYFQFLQVTKEVRLAAVSELDNDFTLSRFSVTILAPPIHIAFKGLVSGDRLYYEWEQDRRVSRGWWPLEGKPSLLEAVQPLALQQLELEVGRAYRIPVFDPLWRLSLGEAELHVADRETIEIGTERHETFRVETSLGQIHMECWVTPDGLILRRRLLGDLVMERASPSDRRGGFGGPLGEPALPGPELAAQAAAEAGAGAGPPTLGLLTLLERLVPGQPTP